MLVGRAGFSAWHKPAGPVRDVNRSVGGAVSRITKHVVWAGILVAVTAVFAQAQVKTATGAVKGKPVDGGATVYFGIPYTAPPVGDLRWKAPQPPLKWDGVRDAS